MSPKAAASDLARITQQLFAQLSHAHGLTRTVRPLLPLLARLQAHAQSKPDSRLLPLAPSKLLTFQRAMLNRTWELLRREPAIAPLLRQAKADPLTAAAARLAALCRLAQEIRPLAGSKAQVRPVDTPQGIELELSVWPASHPSRLACLDFCNAFFARPILRLRGPLSQPTPVRKPSAARVGLRVCQEQFGRFNARLSGLALEQDVEYVHELRVALRRLRGALRVFGSALPAPLRDWEDPLTQWSARLGGCRDEDVLTDVIQCYLQDRDVSARRQMAGLSAACRRRRRESYAQALSFFGSQAFVRGRARLQRCLEQSSGHRSRLGLADLARQELTRRLGKVADFPRRIGDLSPKRLHKLRIAFKWLRYACEFFDPLYAGRLRELTRAATQMQDLLGEVHDADVFLETVRPAGEGKKPASPAVKDFCRCLRSRQKRRLRQAAKAWKVFRAGRSLRKCSRIIDGPTLPPTGS